ncbi:MAG: diacylglycerol kinase family protein [Planctomycetes bacterium]|nr:diacylglycerol kinase family protein [Planctomycetota bacterium]
MNGIPEKPRRTWSAKFTDAFRGLAAAVRTQSSFAVHLLATVVVVAGAGVLRVSGVEWCLLVFACATVLTTEMINTALERLAAAVHPQQSPLVGQALDIASGAVLVASLGAVAIGAIVFIPRLLA